MKLGAVPRNIAELGVLRHNFCKVSIGAPAKRVLFLIVSKLKDFWNKNELFLANCTCFVKILLSASRTDSDSALILLMLVWCHAFFSEDKFLCHAWSV